MKLLILIQWNGLYPRFGFTSQWWCMLIKNEYLVWSSYKNFIGASIPTMIASQAAETCDTNDSRLLPSVLKRLSGVNSCMPLFQILEAVKYLIGFGAGIRIAKLIGENSKKEVNITYTLSVINIFVVGLLLPLVTSLFGLSLLCPISSAMIRSSLPM